MKHILTILVAFVLTINVNAQEQKKEKADKAKKVTAEMTEVLSLDQITSAKVYEFQQNKVESIKVATKENKDDKEALKAKKKEINSVFKEEMVALIGKDKMKVWSEHMKNNRGGKNKEK